MQESSPTDNQFVVDLLTTLKKERFSPSGWWRFFARSWAMSCTTAAANPALTRSWVRITSMIGLLSLLILIVTFLLEGTGSMLRLLPGFLFCVAWQQSDLFWHLGLHRQANTGRALPYIGGANILTGLRGLCASYLIGRLCGGLFTPATLTLMVFLCGVTTDILDGPLARKTHTQSKLGQIIDAEADFCLYLAMTIILIQNALLPLWAGIVMLLRFCVPLLAALGSYFLLAQQVRFGSTVWGKYAGLAQTLYFLLLLAPPAFASLTHILNLPLLILTLALLIIAPVAQILQNT